MKNSLNEEDECLITYVNKKIIILCARCKNYNENGCVLPFLALAFSLF